ncbi:MAG TPA: thioredoxin domain-containing protein [Solirubrobacteraceae bacterium]|jgi:protein-disulfide isomerase|nr:thioredoxin domain-containing protein [Solirubrobacteraceae bacterium]
MAPGDERPTRKEMREQARAERLAVQRAAEAAAAQRKRLYMLGGAVLIVVAILAVVIVIASSNNNHALQKGKAANATVSQVSSLLAGVPQNGNTLGDPSAPVLVEYFGDLECPVCKAFTSGTLPQVIQDEVRTDQVKIEYRSLETATQDPTIFTTQQTAAEAAGAQNKLWDFVELFYHEQGEEDSGYVTETYLRGLASQVPGLNFSTWLSDRQQSKYSNIVVQDQQVANAQGFGSTPTFVIQGPKGTKSLVGDYPYSDFSSAVNSVA